MSVFRDPQTLAFPEYPGTLGVVVETRNPVFFPPFMPEPSRDVSVSWRGETIDATVPRWWFPKSGHKCNVIELAGKRYAVPAFACAPSSFPVNYGELVRKSKSSAALLYLMRRNRRRYRWKTATLVAMTCYATHTGSLKGDDFPELGGEWSGDDVRASNSYIVAIRATVEIGGRTRTLNVWTRRTLGNYNYGIWSLTSSDVQWWVQNYSEGESVLITDARGRDEVLGPISEFPGYSFIPPGAPDHDRIVTPVTVSASTRRSTDVVICDSHYNTSAEEWIATCSNPRQDPPVVDVEYRTAWSIAYAIGVADRVDIWSGYSDNSPIEKHEIRLGRLGTPPAGSAIFYPETTSSEITNPGPEFSTYTHPDTEFWGDGIISGGVITVVDVGGTWTARSPAGKQICSFGRQIYRQDSSAVVDLPLGWSSIPEKPKLIISLWMVIDPAHGPGDPLVLRYFTVGAPGADFDFSDYGGEGQRADPPTAYSVHCGDILLTAPANSAIIHTTQWINAGGYDGYGIGGNQISVSFSSAVPADGASRSMWDDHAPPATPDFAWESSRETTQSTTVSLISPTGHNLQFRKIKKTVDPDRVAVWWEV